MNRLIIRKCLSQIQTSSRNHFLKENKNSVSPGCNFWKESCNQDVTSKTSRISLRWILNFQEHSKENITKAHKGIAVSTKMQDIILKGRFLAIYISFIRPYLDYCDDIYYQPNSWNFHHKIEFIQYKASLAVLGREFGLILVPK